MPDAETPGPSEAEKKSARKPAKKTAEANLRVSASPLLSVSPRMLAAGVIAGMLPLIHAHSFIATMGVAGVLALINIKKWREWLAFIVVASVIAIPQMLWSTHGSAVSTKQFIGWELGWGHANENVFWFWFKNTGFFIPLLVAALLWKTDRYLVSRKLLLFYLPFTLCFIVPNMVKLAPWIWDNIKILYYWWIASAPIVALLLAKLWDSGHGNRILAIFISAPVSTPGHS